MDNSELICSPIERHLVNIIKEVKESLFIVTPFIKEYGIKIILDHLSPSHISLLTNLETSNLITPNIDVSAILKLWDKNKVDISSLGKLHAKVYIADNKVALITSANLTHGGLCDNYEYGVIFREEIAIQNLRNDMLSYFDLGNKMDESFIQSIKHDVEEIINLRKRLDKSHEAIPLFEIYSKKTNDLQERILSNHLREGKTINSIFSQTILYLLKKWGPLSTRQINPLVQQIHPDICDDHIDRIINGQHFGKKWKHLVRDAQQFLKNKEAITLIDGKWTLL